MLTRDSDADALIRQSLCATLCAGLRYPVGPMENILGFALVLLVIIAFLLMAILKSVNTLVYQGAQKLPKPSEMNPPHPLAY